MKRLNRNRLGFLVLGLALGLVVGLNVQGLWPNVPLHASATASQENFAIATGFVDEDVEAIYFLDFLTGDLKAAVIQVRTGGPTSGKFNAFFAHNILSDFGSEQTKNPKYLMVTGEANLPRGRQNFQFAKSIVYIAEATTGQVACYTIPWNSALAAAGRPQKGTFVPLDKQQFRTAIIRDQE